MYLNNETVNLQHYDYQFDIAKNNLKKQYRDFSLIVNEKKVHIECSVYNPFIYKISENVYVIAADKQHKSNFKLTVGTAKNSFNVKTILLLEDEIFFLFDSEEVKKDFNKSDELYEKYLKLITEGLEVSLDNIEFSHSKSQSDKRNLKFIRLPSFKEDSYPMLLGSMKVFLNPITQSITSITNIIQYIFKNNFKDNIYGLKYNKSNNRFSLLSICYISDDPASYLLDITDEELYNNSLYFYSRLPENADIDTLNINNIKSTRDIFITPFMNESGKLSLFVVNNNKDIINMDSITTALDEMNSCNELLIKEIQERMNLYNNTINLTYDKIIKFLERKIKLSKQMKEEKQEELIEPVGHDTEEENSEDDSSQDEQEDITPEEELTTEEYQQSMNDIFMMTRNEKLVWIGEYLYIPMNFYKNFQYENCKNKINVIHPNKLGRILIEIKSKKLQS